MNGKTKCGVASIRCPYFRMHSAVEIGCEGITEGSWLRLQFATGQGRNMHEDIFCAAKYENCELFRAISEQYAEV